MRKIQLNISVVGNVIVRQSDKLIVSIDILRSLCVESLSALRRYVSPLLGDTQWQEPGMTWINPVTGTNRCYATAMQRLRGHEKCHRWAALHKGA